MVKMVSINQYKNSWIIFPSLVPCSFIVSKEEDNEIVNHSYLVAINCQLKFQ